MLLTSRPRKVSTPDKFLMPRSFVLWPQLPTATVGAWVKNLEGSIFAGFWEDPAKTQGNYLEWDNVPLSPGTWKAKFFGRRRTDGGVIHIFHDGGDTGARLDTGGSNTTYFLAEDTFTVSPKTLGTLRAICASTNTAGYAFEVYQIILEKVSSGANNGTGHGDLDWFIDVSPPDHTSTDAPNLINAIATTAGRYWGMYLSAGAGNTIPWFMEWDVWLTRGNHDMILAFTDANGAMEFSLDGSSIATYDPGGIGGFGNNEIETIQTNISVGQTKKYTLRMDVTDGAAVGFSTQVRIHWMQFRRTSL